MQKSDNSPEPRERQRPNGPDAGALVVEHLSRDRRVLLLGQPGVGKSTLAAAMGAEMAGRGRECWCLGADPGLPAFGVPGALTRAEWREDAWRSRAMEALCTLDAGRFRLPLVGAVRRLAGEASSATLLVDGPGVVRGTPGEELLSGIVEAAAIDLLLVLSRGGREPPLQADLAALGVQFARVEAHPLARRPGRPARARHRTALWTAYLQHAGERVLRLSDLQVVGTPPPISAPSAWRGRQAALLDERAHLLAMGEVTALDGDALTVRMPSCGRGTTLLVRNAARAASGLLETAEPFAAERMSYPPLPAPGFTGGRSEAGEQAPTGRVGNMDVGLVNGVFGDPLLHLRFRYQRRSLLFDLGAGGRLPARVAHEVTDLFVSHAHMDHIAGFLWLMRSRIGSFPTCRIYGPPGITRHIENLVGGILWDRVGPRGPRFEVMELQGNRLSRCAIQAGWPCRRALDERTVEAGILLQERGFLVRACELDHGTPVLAYAFEPERQFNVRKDRLLARGLAPGPWLGELKSGMLGGDLDREILLPGEAWETVGSLADDLVLIRPGKKVVYATDLGDTPENRSRLSALARGAHTFFCESPFLEADAAQATRTGHLTTRACGEIANEAGVAHLVPFHFSRRYESDAAPLYEEISAICSRVRWPSALAGDEAV